jgi:hypothetical protein
MAIETNGTTPEKSSDKTAPSLERSFPEQWRGVRYTTTPSFAYGMLDSGWTRAEIANADGAELVLDVRYSEGDPATVETVSISVDHEDDEARMESMADLDPDTAAELALTILDEVGDSL